MSRTSTRFGSSSESLPGSSGYAKAILHKLKNECKAAPEKVRTFAKKTKAFAKRAHLKRAREHLNEKKGETNSSSFEKKVEAFEASNSVHLTVGLPKHAVPQVSKSNVNVDPATQPHEITAEYVSEKVDDKNVMEMRGSMDVEKHVLTTQPERCEEEITKEADAQNSTAMGVDFITARTPGKHRDVMREDEHGSKLEVWTTSYCEVTGFHDDNFTAADVEEILDYMPEHRENSLWRKTEMLPVSFEELYGQWGDRYTADMNDQEAKAPGFGGSPGESDIPDNRESYSAIEHSSSMKSEDNDVTTEARDVKGETLDEEERTESLENSFSDDNDVDNNTKVLVNDVHGAHAPEQVIVQHQVSVLHVHCVGEKSSNENEEMNCTVCRGIGLVVVAIGSGLLIGHRFFY